MGDCDEDLLGDQFKKRARMSILKTKYYGSKNKKSPSILK